MRIKVSSHLDYLFLLCLILFPILRFAHSHALSDLCTDNTLSISIECAIRSREVFAKVLEMLQNEVEGVDGLVSAIEYRNANSALLNECYPSETYDSCCALGGRRSKEVKERCEVLMKEIKRMDIELIPAFDRVPSERLHEYMMHIN